MFEKFKKETYVMLVNATGVNYVRVEICTGLIERSNIVLQGKNSTVTDVYARGGYKVRYYENDQVVGLVCERVSDQKIVIQYEASKDEDINMHPVVKKLSRITGMHYDYFTSIWCEAWNNRGEKLVA